MALNHFIKPTAPDVPWQSVRLGAGSGSSNQVDSLENNKFVKLVAESRYNLCAVGDAIEAQIQAVELAPQNDFSIGSILSHGLMYATADGLQGTPGTGTIAVGDLVVCGTVVAKGTALTAHPKVCKATSQAAVLFNWRVVSLGTVGTGAVGTTIVIERV